MKNKILYISLFLSIIMGAVSCQTDNYPEPGAHVFGAIRDIEGGALVEQDLQNGTLIATYELGYATPTLKTWVIKENGEYRNNLVFPGSYNIVFDVTNFFPFKEDSVVFSEGDNKHDFIVTPYIRIKNLSIAHDAGAKKIVATFNLEAGKPTVKVKKISLYGFTDMHVGEFIKFGLTAGTGTPTQSFKPSISIDPATKYTLSIDLAANSSFDVSRNYYFRVGAIAEQDSVGTIKTNYAPYVKIAL
jgi:hypothetical protein